MKTTPRKSRTAAFVVAATLVAALGGAGSVLLATSAGSVAATPAAATQTVEAQTVAAKADTAKLAAEKAELERAVASQRAELDRKAAEKAAAEQAAAEQAAAEQRPGDDVRAITMMGESEALTRALEAFGLYGFDGYTYTIDSSRGYECYDFAIEAGGATYRVTINGYTGFVEGEGSVERPGDDVKAVTLMSESEALTRALDAFGLGKYDCYTCDVDSSRGYECYDFAIERGGSTYRVTINGYNGFVVK